MSRPVLHIISQAHLDPVWLWPERDGIGEALTTMQSAVDRAAEFPDFKFTRSSAAVYRWAEEMDPTLFDSVKALIDAGRWEVVGGMIEQPDCNLPSTESFIRQSLYSKQYFESHFGDAGKTSVAYVPDSFGHSGGLPQILKECEFDAYVFMRPQPENGITLPLLFKWQSQDESQVLGIRIPIQYSQSYAASQDDVEKVVRASATQGFAPGFKNGAMWFGVGNHGGGPTREHIERLVELQKDDSLPEIRFSTVREFMEAVKAEAAYAELPVLDHELQYVFRGCYSATGETKQQNRQCEKALFAAESLAVQHGRYDHDLYRDAWWQLGYNQFHDILAGTCVFGTQEEIRTSFGKVSTQARQEIDKAAYAITRSVDTRAETGSVLTVVNALPWERMATVQMDTFSAIHGKDNIVGLEAPDGVVHRVQWMQSEANFGPWGLPWGRLTATLPLPACSHRTFRVITQELEEIFEAPVADDGSVLTEQFIKTGEDEKEEWIAVEPFSSYQTESGIELLSAPPKFVIVDDQSGTWGHFVDRYDQIIETLEYDSVEKIESGEVMTVTRHRTSWDKSTLYLDVIEHHLSGEIELKARFNWQQERQMLKLAFATNLSDAKVAALNAGSIVKREPNHEEYPNHDWVALEGAVDGKKATFALSNDSTYSHATSDGVLYMALARGVPHAEHPPFEYRDTTDLPFLDQGWQERRFWIHAGEDSVEQLDLTSLAQSNQVPAVAVLDSGHPGSRPYEQSQFEVKDRSVGILAIKQSKDGKSTLVRLHNLRDEARSITIHALGEEHSVAFGAWEIKTLSFGTSPSELNGLER